MWMELLTRRSAQVRGRSSSLSSSVRVPSEYATPEDEVARQPVHPYHHPVIASEKKIEYTDEPASLRES